MAERRALSRLWRLFHTVRYLRWRQVWFRLYYRVRPLRVPVAGGARARGGLILDPCRWGGPATGDGRRFDFLGESGDVTTAADWNAPRFSKLWLYNLHYLNDLNAVGADQREALNAALVDRWINDNPPCTGNGWEPYPLSLRLVNLVKWFARDGEVPAHRLDSLATQARALERQVEWPILGNHLFA
ncbi:MAG: heparinase, partial [Alloalcanivorax venustensis]